MNKEQKNAEQQIRLMKFDCEMRAKSVQLASSLSTSKSTKTLIDNAEDIAKYIFGIPKESKEKK